VLEKPESGGSADAAAPAAAPAAAGAAPAPAPAPAAAADDQAGVARTPAAAPGKENRDRTASIKAEPGAAGGGGGSALKTPAAAKRAAPLAGVPTPGVTPSPYTPCAPSRPGNADAHRGAGGWHAQAAPGVAGDGSVEMVRRRRRRWRHHGGGWWMTAVTARASHEAGAPSDAVLGPAGIRKPRLSGCPRQRKLFSCQGRQSGQLRLHGQHTDCGKCARALCRGSAQRALRPIHVLHPCSNGRTCSEGRG